MPKIKDILFVTLQLFLMLVYFLNFDWFSISFIEHYVWFYIGLVGVAFSVIALLQLNVHLSPFPTPKPNSKLITNGVFKLSRHPVYSGILLFMFCFSFWLGSGYKFCISIAILALFFYKTKYEEALLEDTFDEYKAYKSKTGRFFPKF